MYTSIFPTGIVPTNLLVPGDNTALKDPEPAEQLSPQSKVADLVGLDVGLALGAAVGVFVGRGVGGGLGFLVGSAVASWIKNEFKLRDRTVLCSEVEPDPKPKPHRKFLEAEFFIRLKFREIVEVVFSSGIKETMSVRRFTGFCSALSVVHFCCDIHKSVVALKKSVGNHLNCTA